MRPLCQERKHVQRQNRGAKGETVMRSWRRGSAALRSVQFNWSFANFLHLFLANKRGGRRHRSHQSFLLTPTLCSRGASAAWKNISNVCAFPKIVFLMPPEWTLLSAGASIMLENFSFCSPPEARLHLPPALTVWGVAARVCFLSL